MGDAAIAILSVAGTLLAVWLGSRLSRRDEAQQWRRERCLEAYAEVMRACQVVLFETTAAYEKQRGTEEAVKQVLIVLEKIQEMYLATDRAVLLAPHDLGLALRELANYCGTDIGEASIASPKPSREEWRNLRDGAAPPLGHFINCARNDLGIHEPLHTIEEWYKIVRPRGRYGNQRR